MAEENKGGAEPNKDGANGEDKNKGGAPEGGEAGKPTKNEDGTVTIDGKAFISKDSYDVIAEKQRQNTLKLEKIEKDKAKAEEERLKEQGEYKTLAEHEKTKREELEKAVIHERKSNALKLAAMQEGTVDAEALERLADLDKITVSEDGAVDQASVKAVVDEMKKEKVYLFGNPGENPTPKQPIGSDGGAPKGGGEGGEKTFYRSQLSDKTFYDANREEILAAASRKGGIIDDVSGK